MKKRINGNGRPNVFDRFYLIYNKMSKEKKNTVAVKYRYENIDSTPFTWNEIERMIYKGMPVVRHILYKMSRLNKLTKVVTNWGLK